MVREWWKLATNWPPKKGVQIRLVRRGCVNREFFQIGVMPVRRRPGLPPKEVIGSYDPMPNEKGEKLVALDLDRFFFWMGQGALLSRGVFTTLGLSGVLPLHPYVYRQAWTQRMAEQKNQESGETSEKHESVN